MLIKLAVGGSAREPRGEEILPWYMEVRSFEPETPIFQPNDQTIEGSFSAVSAPIVANKYSCSALFEICKIVTLLHPSKLKIATKFRQNVRRLVHFPAKIAMFL